MGLAKSGVSPDFILLAPLAKTSFSMWILTSQQEGAINISGHQAGRSQIRWWGCGPVVRLLACNARVRRLIPFHPELSGCITTLSVCNTP